MAFILAWPLLLGLKVTHRPKGKSRWEKNVYLSWKQWPFWGILVLWSGKPGFTVKVCEQMRDWLAQQLLKPGFG